MPITAPPTIPQITDPSTFATRAQDWVVWQANQLYPSLIEESLLLGLSLSGTSVTSNTIGTGSKSFTTQTGLGFKAGQSLSIARTSAPTNRMFVVVDSYDSVTGTLVVTSQAFEGSGTFTDWSIALAFNGVITTDQIDEGAVTTNKILDSNVTPAKLSDEAKTDKIQPITASVSSNALTITLNPTVLDFRSGTLASGTVNTRAINSAISTVISSGSTGGTVNGVQSRIVVLAIDNAGTVVLGWTNLAGGLQLNETNLITTTAEGGAGGADSANVIYTTVAVTTPSPYRVVGYVESTQATAGSWATAPSTIQGYGGQALAAMSSLGYGQIWQDVTGSRTTGTTYYNTTGKPIQAIFSFATNNNVSYGITVNGVLISRSASTGNGTEHSISVVIPPNAAYIYSTNPLAVNKIYELR